MGQNRNSVVVHQIPVKFWWMIPMGVKYNHTKSLSKKLNGGGRERDPQVADLSFKNCILGPKTVIFGPKKPWNTFKTAKRRETMGMCHVRLDFTVSTSSLRPSNSMICPGNGPKRPPQAPNADNHKPRIGHIFGYMAQNAIPRAPIPPATPHFLWFPPLKIAQTDAYTPIPRPTRLRQAASSSPNRWVPKWVNRVQ